jgi:hypothetical protein
MSATPGEPQKQLIEVHADATWGCIVERVGDAFEVRMFESVAEPPNDVVLFERVGLSAAAMIRFCLENGVPIPGWEAYRERGPR